MQSPVRGASTKTLTLALCVAGAATLVAGCASTAFEDPDDALRREIRSLRSEIVELQKKSVVSEVEILRLRERVAELQARDQTLAEQLRAAGGTPATAPPPRTSQPVVDAPLPAAVEVSDLDDFGTVKAQGPGTRSDVEPTTTSNTAQASDVDSAASAAGSEATSDPIRASQPSSDPLGDAAQALYDQGFTEFHEGRYLEAETSLQRFLDAHPTSQWSDNALYWIGESRFARRDYRGALAAFRETANRFPEGNKVPDALLKAGQALEQLGDVRSARQSYQEVVKRFGSSATALIAEERLRQLGG